MKILTKINSSDIDANCLSCVNARLFHIVGHIFITTIEPPNKGHALWEQAFCLLFGGCPHLGGLPLFDYLIMFNDTRNEYKYIIDVELVITKQNITKFYFMNECINHARLYQYHPVDPSLTSTR